MAASAREWFWHIGLSGRLGPEESHLSVNLRWASLNLLRKIALAHRRLTPHRRLWRTRHKIAGLIVARSLLRRRQLPIGVSHIIAKSRVSDQFATADGVDDYLNRAELGPLQRWMQAIRQIILPRYMGQVVIFVDEIDAGRSLPFSTDEFFAGIREVYNRRMDDETNPLVSVLRLSGITRVENGRLQVRNRIYERVFDREWAQANMPDAELRRQREAYRRGLLRATAVASLIIILFSGLSIYAFSQRNRADQYAREQERTLTRLQSALAEAKRQEGVAIEQSKLAEEQNRLAAKQRTEAEEQRRVAVRQRAEAQTQRDRAVWQEQSNRRLLYAAHMNLAQQAWENSEVGRVDELLEPHRPHSGEEELRGFEWYYLWRLSHRFLSILRHNDTVYSVAFSPDGKRLATGSFDSTVKLWDAATGQETLTLKGHVNGVCSVAFSADGRWLATGSDDRTVKLWDAATGKELLTLKGHSGAVRS